MSARQPQADNAACPDPHAVAGQPLTFNPVVAAPRRRPSTGSGCDLADLQTARGRLVRADGYPPHRDRFEHAGYDLVRLLGDSSYRALDDLAI